MNLTLDDEKEDEEDDDVGGRGGDRTIFATKTLHDPHSVRKMLHDAIQAGWINQNRTHAVFVEWVLYNPNANMFAFAQGVVEFSSTSNLGCSRAAA